MLVLLVLLHPWPALAGLFDEQAPLSLQLSGPFALMLSDKRDLTQKQFVLSHASLKLDVKVKLRGKSRLRVCDFPPLRINFKTEQVKGSIFAGQDKLKLVTHCNSTARAEQNVLDEYAAYRIFNHIHSSSFRVRLVEISYVDTASSAASSSEIHHGFLIEWKDALSRRLGGAMAELPAVPLSAFDQVQLASVFIFQYLIGNTDWSLVRAENDDLCCHNGTLVRVDGKLNYVPYDFDLSGVVNARYAKPDPSLRLRRVTQRLYRGYCIADDSLAKALQQVAEKRTEILGTFDELPGLSEADRAAKTRYLDQFFDQSDNPKKLLRSFSKRCI